MERARVIGRFREYQVANHDRLLRAYDGVVAVIRGFSVASHPGSSANRVGDLL